MGHLSHRARPGPTRPPRAQGRDDFKNFSGELFEVAPLGARYHLKVLVRTNKEKRSVSPPCARSLPVPSLFRRVAGSSALPS